MIFLEQLEDFGRGKGADALVHPPYKNGTLGLEGFGTDGFEVNICEFSEGTVCKDFIKVRRGVGNEDSASWVKD